jgi:glycosyltransferase involved in cell wall biosynthesis
VHRGSRTDRPMAYGTGMNASCPPRPLAVLMLSHYFDDRRGGVEIVAANLARELAGLGFELTWLAAAPQMPVAPQEACDIRRVSLPALDIAEKVLGIPYPILLPAAWVRIFRQVRRSDIVLVHDTLYMSTILARIASRAFRKPLVVVQHIALVPYKSALLRGMMKLANACIATPTLRNAARVVFISHTTMRDFCGIHWKRAPSLIFNGVDTDIFQPAGSERLIEQERENLQLPIDRPIALFVGRFVEKKGLNVLQCLARSRPDVSFAFAGHGPLDPAAWGLSNTRVYRDLSGRSLAGLYRASDLLLLPSVGEGFPLVVQEALACGLPVVCGADTAEADLRAAAFLRAVRVDLASPKETASRFSDAMTQLLAAPFKTSRSAGFDYARNNYSWTRAAEAYAGIFRELHSVAPDDETPGESSNWKETRH